MAFELLCCQGWVPLKKLPYSIYKILEGMNYDDEYDNDDDWTPPTEAELKEMADRRARSDKVSKVMGQYMLKGW